MTRPDPGAPPAFFRPGYTPARIPPLYRIAAVGVLVMVVAQVVLYLGLLGAGGYGVYRWATDGLFLLNPGQGDPTRQIRSGRVLAFLWIVRATGYAAPLLAGGAVVLALAAPLIPRRREERPAVSLDRAGQARIHEYVDRLCDVMSAPRPVRIDVVCEPNASAHMEGGLLGVLSGRRLVLTIGLPLAAGMRRSELTGVIAHELGHFTQGGGMRSTWVIRSINRWFEHAVFHRGRMDEAIDEALNDGWWPFLLVAFVCRVMLGLVRLVLTGFMYASHAVSAFLLRRMEFAADACEARVAGSRAAAWASARIIELSVGWERALEHTRSLWVASRRLPDDLPRLTVRTAPTGKRRPDGFLAAYRDEAKWWSTHPGMNERVKAIVAANEPGIMVSDGPASALFADFDALCRITSAHLHLSALGSDYGEDRLVPIERVLGAPAGARSVETVPVSADEDAAIPLV